MSPIKHGCDCGKYDCISYPECLYTYNMDDWDCPHYKTNNDKKRKSNLMTSYRADTPKKIVIIVNSCDECDFCDHDFDGQGKGINHKCTHSIHGSYCKELDIDLCFGGVPEWCPLEDV